jgi:ribosomal protein L4
MPASTARTLVVATPNQQSVGISSVFTTKTKSKALGWQHVFGIFKYPNWPKRSKCIHMLDISHSSPVLRTQQLLEIFNDCKDTFQETIFVATKLRGSSRLAGNQLQQVSFTFVCPSPISLGCACDLVSVS